MSENIIKRRREELRLSQEGLALKLGVSAMTVSRWERGDHLPSRRHWPKIKEETGLSPADLVSGAAA